VHAGAVLPASALALFWRLGTALVAAEMLGLAEEASARIYAQLRTRVQFGHPIGSFQALQHRAAELSIDLELGRAAVEAALAHDAQPATVSAAKVMMGEALFRISTEMVQLHGGIGMTDAHDAGLFLKRSRSLEALFGNRGWHRDRYARMRGY
jgi:alkylation response protein AidB-like acyl-CoA dehydrogenase